MKCFHRIKPFAALLTAGLMMLMLLGAAPIQGDTGSTPPQETSAPAAGEGSVSTCMIFFFALVV